MTSPKNPMKLSDTIIESIKYPVILQPKTDGVRGLNDTATLYTRTLKPFANIHTQALLSNSLYEDFDGELYVGNITDQNLCRTTTSNVNRIKGEPNVKWMIFDLRSSNLPYIERLQVLKDRIDALGNPNITLVEWTIIHNEDELLQLEEKYLNMGYEGVVIRTINGGYKNGRIGKTDPIATRIKRFIEEEAVVIDLIEANENQNEKQTNELGHSFRSSHQENMVGKNSLGTLICKDIKTGQEIKVGPGNLTHIERDYLWVNPDKIIGQVIKYKSFPKGVKDKPRFPTYVNLTNGDLNLEFVSERPEFDR